MSPCRGLVCPINIPSNWIKDMDQDKATELLEKYHAGTCTEAERAAVEAWYNFYGSSTNSEAVNEDLALRKEIIWKHVNSTKGKVVKLNIWKYTGVAAAVALIVLGVYFFNYRNGILKQVQDDVVVNDIAPGRNVATLTLGNGKIINLSDTKTGVVINNDKLAYNDGTNINDPSLAKAISPGGRESNTQMLTASTPRGGTYQVILPDGTKVWLNADSKLEFPSKFGKNEQRIVRLSGEGYFEVVHNAKQPFKVKSKGQVVEDIGTEFNINAYGDEAVVRTTLVEGSARVIQVVAPATREIASAQSGRPRNDVVLKPNQQAVVSGSSRIAVKDVDVSTVVDWKNGEFVFDKEPLEQILQKVARWYDVDITDLRKQKNNITFTGKMSRYDNISKVLSKLALTDEVNFKIEGRKVIVSK
jgi:transmembrane sensor